MFPSAPLSYRIRRHPRLKNIQRTTAFPSSFFRFAANFVRRVPSLLISTPPDEIRLLNVSRRACNEYCYETFKFNVPIERIARTYSIHDTKWQPWSMIFWLPECNFDLCNFDLEKSNLIPVKKVVNISTTHFYFDFLNFHETLNFIILIETELEPFTVKFKIPGYFEIQFIARIIIIWNVTRRISLLPSRPFFSSRHRVSRRWGIVI